MILNPNPKTDWEIGQTCYFARDYYDAPREGRIKGMDIESSFPTVTVACPDSTSFLNTESLFETHEDVVAAKVAYYLDKVRKLEAEMPDVGALVRFAYTHQVSPYSGYTNRETLEANLAREAYRNRAKDLLGITLTKEDEK